jgi:hypothetical protein
MDGLLVNIDDAIAALDADDVVAAHPRIQQYNNETQQQEGDGEAEEGKDEEVVSGKGVDDNTQLEFAVASVAPKHPNIIYSKSSNLNIHITYESLVAKGIKYLEWHAVHTKKCPHQLQKKGQTNTCSCMSNFLAKDLADEEGNKTSDLTLVTAHFIAYFAKQKRETQQMHVMFWYCMATLYWMAEVAVKSKYSSYMFPVPVLSDIENNIVIRTALLVCMSVMQ